MRRRIASSFVTVLLVLGLAMPAIADCRHVRPGDHVVLYGNFDDPSVFVWDTKIRLRDYHAGSSDEAQALLPHAQLVSPGTRAVVEACLPRFVVAPTLTDDAIGIIVLTGDGKGQAGWVLGTDVRPVQPATGARAKPKQTPSAPP